MSTMENAVKRGVNVNDGAFGEAAYCHHRHHHGEDASYGPAHSTDFDTCPHRICTAARTIPPRLTARDVARYMWNRDGRPDGHELGETNRRQYERDASAVFAAIKALGGRVTYPVNR